MTAGRAGRGAYTLSIFSGTDRIRSLAFMRSARNIGCTLGALLGGVALALDDLDAVRAVPLVTAVVLLVNAALVRRLPNDLSSATTASGSSEGAETLTPEALRNRGFLLMTTCDGVLGTNQVLLNVVIPLWLVEQTDAPRVLLAWLFGTNTVLAVLLQVAASRGAETAAGALPASRLSVAFFVLSCSIVLVTHDTVGWVTIALVWIGHVTVTGAELYQSASHWGLVAELSDPARRSEVSTRTPPSSARPRARCGHGGLHVLGRQRRDPRLARHRCDHGHRHGSAAPSRLRRAAPPRAARSRTRHLTAQLARAGGGSSRPSRPERHSKADRPSVSRFRAWMSAPSRSSSSFTIRNASPAP